MADDLDSLKRSLSAPEEEESLKPQKSVRGRRQPAKSASRMSLLSGPSRQASRARLSSDDTAGLDSGPSAAWAGYGYGGSDGGGGGGGGSGDKEEEEEDSEEGGVTFDLGNGYGGGGSGVSRAASRRMTGAGGRSARSGVSRVASMAGMSAAVTPERVEQFRERLLGECCRLERRRGAGCRALTASSRQVSLRSLLTP